MSPSLEKERIDHQVLHPIFSGTEPDRNTLAEYQIHLAAFFGISVYKRLERCVGTHPEKLWVKIPNYFCLSAYLLTGLVVNGKRMVKLRCPAGAPCALTTGENTRSRPPRGAKAPARGGP